MRFHKRKACWRLVQVQRARFHYHKTYWRRVEFGRVRFDYLNLCWRLVDVQRVRFDYCKVCWRLVQVGRVYFDSYNPPTRFPLMKTHSPNLQETVSNLTTAKHVGRVRFYNRNKASLSEVFS